MLLGDNATYHAVVGWDICKNQCGMNFHTSSMKTLLVCVVLNPCWWALFAHRFVNKLSPALSSRRIYFNKKLVQMSLAETAGLGWTWSSKVDLHTQGSLLVLGKCWILLLVEWHEVEPPILGSILALNVLKTFHKESQKLSQSIRRLMQWGLWLYIEGFSLVFRSLSQWVAFSITSLDFILKYIVCTLG